MTNHRRDDEDDNYEHERRNDMPAWLRWGLESIKQVGFPAVMCLLIWWRSETTQKQLSKSLDEQSASLQLLVTIVNSNHAASKERWDRFLMEFHETAKENLRRQR